MTALDEAVQLKGKRVKRKENAFNGSEKSEENNGKTMHSESTKRAIEFMFERLQSGELDTLVCLGVTRVEAQLSAVVALPMQQSKEYVLLRLLRIRSGITQLITKLFVDSTPTGTSQGRNNPEPVAHAIADDLSDLLEGGEPDLETRDFCRMVIAHAAILPPESRKHVTATLSQAIVAALEERHQRLIASSMKKESMQ